MRTPSSHMNGVSHHEFNQWDLPFMWEERVRIYDIPGIYNNFPLYGGVVECRTYSLPHKEARKSLTLSFSLQQNKLK